MTIRLLLAVVLAARGLTAQDSPRGDSAAQAEDLVAFAQTFLAVDQSYTPAARAEAERRLARLGASAGKISDVQMVLALAQIVALADNGHTMMVGRGDSPAMARVGLRFASFGGEFVLVRALAAHRALLGGRLVAIDGVPVAALRDTARTLMGGTTAWRDRAAPMFLESPGQLHALGIARSSTGATYRIQTADGQSTELTMGPVTDPDGMSGRRAAAMLIPAAAEGAWVSLLPEARAPWALQEFDERMRRRDAPELDATVIQLRANVDVGGQSVAAFLEASDSLRRASGRRNIVLDMRMNGGGNLQLTRSWMSSIVSRLPADGRVVVLMSEWTFSAAISSIGYLKQSGGARVVLVGDSPGDRLHFWAEGRPITLPHSRAMFLPATQRHDYVTGCAGYTDCHGAVVRFPIAVPSLDPEVRAPWSVSTYAAGRDPGMEAAANILRRTVP